MLNTTNVVTKGGYDYCRVPGTRQLTHFEEGEDNSNFELTKSKKNSNLSIWSNKRLLWRFLGMLSPNILRLLCSFGHFLV